MNKSPIAISTKTGLFVIILLSVLYSCGSLKSSGKKYYESFFIGNGGIQFFIKPLKFTDASSQELNLDITLRYYKNISETDSANINFSLISTQLIKEIDSISINNERVNLKATDVNRIFMERTGNQYISRFSSKSKLLPLTNLFLSEEWTITVFHDENTIILTSPPSTSRKIESLNLNIMELIR